MSETGNELSTMQSAPLIIEAADFYIGSVDNAALAYEVPDDEIRQLVVDAVRERQADYLAKLMRLSEHFAWEEIVDQERRAWADFKAAEELRNEAEADAKVARGKLDTSVTLALQIVPDLETKLNDIATGRRESIQGELDSTHEFYNEGLTKHRELESLFLRLGRAWPLPNLIVDMPSSEPTESQSQSVGEESTTSTVTKSESDVFAEVASKGKVLSDREKQMTSLLLAAIRPGVPFRRSDLKLSESGIVFASTAAEENAFSRFTKKLSDSGILSSNGRAGGRSYILNTAVEVPDSAEAQDTAEVVPLPLEEVVTEESPPVEELPQLSDELVQDDSFTEIETKGEQAEPKAHVLKQGREGFMPVEVDLNEISKEIGIKDPQLAKAVVTWVEWLQSTDTFNAPACIKLRKFVMHKGAQLSLYRLSPSKVQGLTVLRDHRHKRLIFAIVDGAPIIREVIDHDDFDAKYNN